MTAAVRVSVIPSQRPALGGREPDRAGGTVAPA